MENYVITITRQFGSLGRLIAKLMAEKLEIEYYDRDIVEKTSKIMNMPITVISDQEELGKISIYSKMRYPLGKENGIIKKEIFDVQKNVILDLACKKSCIIVGRCADYILENYKNCIRIYIYAPYAARFNNCIQRLNMDPDTAKKMIAEVDSARDAYHKKFAKFLPDDINHKNILIDSSLLGVEKTADFLVSLVKEKFYQ